MNDSSVSSIGVNQLKNSQPYILYYVKKNNNIINECETYEIKRKDSIYEEGDLHCKRKESHNFSSEGELTGNHQRKLSIDSKENLSNNLSRKSSAIAQKNDIDVIFSGLEKLTVDNHRKRKNSKEGSVDALKNQNLPSLINKEQAVYNLEIQNIFEVESKPIKEEENKDVKLIPISTNVEQTPKLSYFSKQHKIKKMNRFKAHFNSTFKKISLQKKNFNESLSPNTSLDKNFNDLIEDYEQSFGKTLKRKDSYDLDYDKGRSRKTRIKKPKKILNFQKIAEQKTINY